MTIAVVSGQVATGTSGTSAVNSQQTAAFPNPTTTGNTILAVVRGNIVTTAETVSVSDTEGNSYVWDLFNVYSSGSSDIVSNPSSTTVPAGAAFVGIARCTNANGASNLKVTATIGSTVDAFLDVLAIEVSGAAASSPIDVSSYSAGASGSPATGTFSTSNANDLTLVAFAGQGSAVHAPTITAPSGFTSLQSKTTEGTGDGNDGNASYEIFSTTQSSIDPTWTVANITDWVAIAVAYEASAVPSAPTSLTLLLNSPPDTSVDLEWTNPSGTLTDTAIYYGTTDTFGSATKIDLGTVTTARIVNGLQPGTLYYFWVTASNSAGESLPGGPATWTTQQDTPIPVGSLVAAGAFGLTRAMRQNRVEGTRFQYRNG